MTSFFNQFASFSAILYLQAWNERRDVYFVSTAAVLAEHRATMDGKALATCTTDDSVQGTSGRLISPPPLQLTEMVISVSCRTSRCSLSTASLASTDTGDGPTARERSIACFTLRSLLLSWTSTEMTALNSPPSRKPSDSYQRYCRA
jgi:hypothetical protein